MTDDPAERATAPEEHPSPWGSHTVPEDGGDTITLGPLTLRVRRIAGEFRRRPERVGERQPEPWSRGAVPGWTGEIRLSPAFPGRPLIVQPDEAFWLYREAEARIFVRVPLWVRVEALTTGHGAIEVDRLPTEVHSDTWWGSLAEGELGYHLRTLARREITPDLYTDWMCICPLHLRNRSLDDLLVDRIALRAQHLTIFRAPSSLWSDETRVDYLGEDEGSRIRMLGGVPEEVGDAVRFVPAEIPLPRGFTARTFRMLRGAFSEWF